MSYVHASNNGGTRCSSRVLLWISDQKNTIHYSTVYGVVNWPGRHIVGALKSCYYSADSLFVHFLKRRHTKLLILPSQEFSLNTMLIYIKCGRFSVMFCEIGRVHQFRELWEDCPKSIYLFWAVGKGNILRMCEPKLSYNVTQLAVRRN